MKKRWWNPEISSSPAMDSVRFTALPHPHPPHPRPRPDLVKKRWWNPEISSSPATGSMRFTSPSSSSAASQRPHMKKNLRTEPHSILTGKEQEAETETEAQEMASRAVVQRPPHT